LEKALHFVVLPSGAVFPASLLPPPSLLFNCRSL
jgi:hypothetical protein